MASIEEAEDWESLPADLPASIHMSAGALAGIAEHCILFPIDTVKTRMQVLPPIGSTSTPFSTIYRSIRDICVADGPVALWRGLPSLMLGVGPSHAIYFATYEKCKMMFGFVQSGGSNNILATGAAGACATIVADALMNPFDVIKQRLQIGVTATATCQQQGDVKITDTAKLPCRAPPAVQSCRKAAGTIAPESFVRFSGMWHCFSHTIRTEGFRALYLSYPTTLVMNIPFQSIHFATYEYARHLFQSAPLPGFYSNSSSYSPASHLMAGAVAGAFAALLTTPLDVTKTLLQTRGISSCAEIRRTDSFLRAFALIYRRQGFWGYWRGAKARVIAHMPATAISWSVYEYFKWAFTNYSTFSSATTEYGNKEAIVTMQEQ